MIHITIGLPCHFSEWCEKLLAELLAAAGAPPMAFGADTLEEIGREVLRRDCSNAISVSRAPSSSLRRELLQTGRPVLLTLEEPELAVAALVADHGLSLAEAVRHIASSLTGMLPLMGAANVLVLRATEKESETARASRIAAHFALALDDGAIAAAVTRAGAYVRREPAPPQPPPAIAAPPGLEEAAALVAYDPHAICESVLTPLTEKLAGQALRQIIWPPALFFLGDRPADSPQGLMDVTGNGRCLIFGPYVRLPEGSWSCSLVFGCTPRATGLRLIADAFAGAELGRVTFRIGEAGLFEVGFSFVNSNSDLPLEIRLFVAGAAFEGEIMLVQVRLDPLRARRLAAV